MRESQDKKRIYSEKTEIKMDKPCSTRSKWPVSICQTYTAPSEHPTIMKSSNGLHLMVTTGKRCRDARTTHFLSANESRVTLWSDATLQTHFCILGCKQNKFLRACVIVEHTSSVLFIFKIKLTDVRCNYRAAPSVAWFRQRERRNDESTCQHRDPRDRRQSPRIQKQDEYGRNEAPRREDTTDNLLVPSDQEESDAAANLEDMHGKKKVKNLNQIIFASNCWFHVQSVT